MRTYYLHALHKHTDHAAASISVPAGRAKGQMSPPNSHRMQSKVSHKSNEKCECAQCRYVVPANYQNTKKLYRSKMLSAETNEARRDWRQAETSQVPGEVIWCETVRLSGHRSGYTVELRVLSETGGQGDCCSLSENIPPHTLAPPTWFGDTNCCIRCNIVHSTTDNSRTCIRIYTNTSDIITEMRADKPSPYITSARLTQPGHP